jgi:hypothetical protein
MTLFSSFGKRRGAMPAGIFSLALGSIVLLCGAGPVPVENFLPQGAMQGDLNAGGHNLTNVGTVNATNVVVSGSLTAPTGFTVPYASVTGTPTLGSLATVTPTGTADGSHYLRGDNSWATVPAGYTLPAASAGTLGGVKQGANVAIAGDGTLSITTPVLPANNGSDFASAATTRQNLGVPYSQVLAEAAGNTVTTAQVGALFNYTTGSSALAATLPSAATAGSGTTYYFRKADNSAGSVLVNGVLLGVQGHALEVISDGTAWYNRPFFGGVDTAGNLSFTAAANAGINLNTSGTGQIKANGNAVATTAANTFTGPQTVPGLFAPTGPNGFYVVFLGDSRFAAGMNAAGGRDPVQFTNISQQTSALTGTTSSMVGDGTSLPAFLQNTGFCFHLFCINEGFAGLGIQDAVNKFNAGEVATTGTYTAGGSTIGITGSTSGLSGAMAVAGPGIPIGMQATISGTTATFFDYLGLNRKPSLTEGSGSNPVVFSTLTTTPANGDFINSVQTVHQLSPAVSSHIPNSLAVVGYGLNDTVPRALTGCTITAHSSSFFYSADSSTLAAAYVPGSTITNSNYAAGTTVVSVNYASKSVTVSTTSTNSSPATAQTVTINPTASAWEAVYSAYVNSLVAAGYRVVVLTVEKAYGSVYTPGETNRQAFNSWLVSTYGAVGGIFPVTGVKLDDVASLPYFATNDPTIYQDGTNLTALGNAIKANGISQFLAANYGGFTGTPQYFGPGSSLYDSGGSFYMPFLQVGPSPIGSIDSLVAQFKGPATSVLIGVGDTTIEEDNGQLFKFGTGGPQLQGGSSNPGKIMVLPTSQSTTTGLVQSATGTLTVNTTTAANLTAQTAAVTIATVTPTAAGSDRVGGYVSVTALATDTSELEVTYTDENSVAQTQLFYPLGASSALISGTGAYVFPSMDIRVKANTAVTLKTILPTSSGSITYDAGGTIQQAY